MSDLQGTLPTPHSEDELASNSAYHREMVFFVLTIYTLNLGVFSAEEVFQCCAAALSQLQHHYF